MLSVFNKLAVNDTVSCDDAKRILNMMQAPLNIPITPSNRYTFNEIMCYANPKINQTTWNTVAEIADKMRLIEKNANAIRKDNI